MEGTRLSWITCCTNTMGRSVVNNLKVTISGNPNKEHSHLSAALCFMFCHLVGQRWPTHHPQLEPVFSWSLLCVEPLVMQIPSYHKQMTEGLRLWGLRTKWLISPAITQFPVFCSWLLKERFLARRLNIYVQFNSVVFSCFFYSSFKTILWTDAIYLSWERKK